MGRGFSTARGLTVLATLLSGCGPAGDYVSEVQIPQAQAPAAAPGIVINVGETGERYPIRLSWPSQVGQRGRIHLDIDETRTTTLRRVGGATDAKTEHKRVVADGLAVTLAVDERGSTTKAEVMLDALDAEIWGAPPVHLKNATVHIERGDSEEAAVVTIDGRDTQAKPERDAIDELVTLKLAPDLPTDDETFGTTDPVAPGGRWPVRGDAVRRALGEEDLHIPPGGVRGEETFERLTDRKGVPCLEITGTLDIQPFEAAGLPPEAHVERAALHVVSHMVIPTTPGPRFEDDLTMTTDITLATSDGSLIESHSNRASKRSFAPERPD